MTEDDKPYHVVHSEEPRGLREIAAVPFRSVRLNGALQDFSRLVDPYGERFVGKLLDGFTKQYRDANPLTAGKGRANLIRCLLYIDNLPNVEDENLQHIVSFREKLKSSKFSDISKLEITGFCDHIYSILSDISNKSILSSDNKTSRKSFLEPVSSVLQDLAAEGFWPDPGPIRSMPSGRHYGDAKSIGELMQIARKGIFKSDLKISQATKSINEANKQGMARLRQHFEEVLIKNFKFFQDGQNLINSLDKSVSERMPSALKHMRTRDAADIENDHPDYAFCFKGKSSNERLAALLYCLKEYESGLVVPSKLEPKLRTHVDHYGSSNVRAMLEGTWPSLVAAMGILMIDTGLNPQPCQDLAWDAWGTEIRHGEARLLTIPTFKKRRGALVEPVVTDCKAYTKARGGQISSVRAVEMWKEMAEPIRKRAEQQDDHTEQYLRIIPYGTNNSGEIRQCNSYSFYDQWKFLLSEIADDPDIGGLPISRKTLRATFTQINAIAGNLNANSAAMMSHHSEKVSFKHYLSRPYIHRLMDAEIRRFQDRFEAVILGVDRDRHIKIGRDADKQVALYDDAVATGLGWLCSNPNAGIQPETEPGELCLKIHACVDCPLMIFHPNDEAIKDIVQLKLSLDRSASSFIAQNPQRWIQVWLPTHAYAIAICKTLENSRFKASYQKIVTEFSSTDLPIGRASFVPW